MLREVALIKPISRQNTEAESRSDVPSDHPAGIALAPLAVKLRMFPAAPPAVPTEPIAHPTCSQTLRAFPIPLLARLPSKGNRLHLARLPRRPRAAGAQPREWVCVEACGRTAAPATPPFWEGGILGPKARAWGYTEHTAPEPAGPDAPGARLRAICLDDQGNLSLNSSSGKWAHNGP